MSRRYHLAQANLGRMRGAIDDPVMEGFVSQLEFINTVADKSPGFVWRLQTEDGDATAIRVFDDDRILFNMSVWESVEALHDYTYRGAHAAPFKERARWFEKTGGPSVVLRWIPVGHTPTVEEARERLELVREHGPTARAFTFRHRFPVPTPGAGDEEFDLCDSAP